jgi:hypothetical protein
MQELSIQLRNSVVSFWGRTLFEKLIVNQYTNKLIAFYATEMFIAGFTRARYWFLVRAG